MAHKQESKQQGQSLRWKAQKASFRGVSASGLHNDDAGIFVTSDKGQEAKCLRDMDDILSEYISSNQDGRSNDTAINEVSDGGDIAADIEKEIKSMKSTSTDQKKAYTSVTLDIPCVSFIRTLAPLDPVSLVRQICEDADSPLSRQRSRYVRRLTPITCMRKTLDGGLGRLCEVVLKPVFGKDDTAKKFAIRPNIRNNDKVNRDVVIKTVADAVARLNSNHSVDLKDYDCLILVEVYRNVCGMSIVGPEFEKLKRFNLSEIYQASNPEQLSGKNEVTG